jgi:hypothetical protein
MLLEDPDEDESELDSDSEEYGYEDSWVPDEDEFWKNEDD